MKTLLFSPAAYNLAEVTRCIEIAKVCRQNYKILFISYGGEFEKEIIKEDFEIVKTEPQLTPKKIQHLYDVSQGKTFGYLFSAKDVREQLKNEIELFRKIKPAAVITGFNFSNSISCRVVKVPIVWLTHSTWMIDKYYQAGYGQYVDIIDLKFLRIFGEKFLTWLARKLLNFTNWVFCYSYDKVAKEYGLKPFKTLEKLLEGNFNLLAEPNGFCKLDLPKSYHLIGPLIGKLDIPVPEEVLNIPKDKPLVYFAMGSSGQAKVMKKIIEGFKDKPFYVISPAKSILKKIDVDVPENVILTDWLPAHKVNLLADISVIHGGIGTTMTAVLAGKPIVGVGMQLEQEFNVDCLVQKGFAIRIKKNRLTPKNLCAAILKLLRDEEAKKKAKEYQKLVEKWNDPKYIREFFRENI